MPLGSTGRRGARRDGLSPCSRCGLVLVVLTAPDRLDEMSPSAFLRLPVEALVVLVALLLALPDRARRVRGLVVATAGLRARRARDLQAARPRLRPGAQPALRPADRLALRRATSSRPSAARPGSARRWSCWRSPGSCCSPRSSSCRSRCAGSPGPRSGTDRPRCASVAVLLPLWLVLSLLDVRGRHRPGRLRRRGVVRPRAGRPGSRPSCATSASSPARRPTTRCATPRPPTCSPGCAARTCWWSSSRATAGSRSTTRALSPGVVAALDDGTRRLEARRLRARAAPTSPPPRSARSAGSPTRRSSPGSVVDSQQRYDVLVTTDRRDPVQPVRRAGWRTVAVGPGQRPRLAAGRVLRLRPRLRLAQRRLPRAALRLPDDARPVHPRRVPAARARAARPSTGDGRDRPDQQPRAVVADPRPAAAGGRRRRVRLRRACPRRCPPRPTSGPTRGRVRAAYAHSIDVLAAGGRLASCSTYGDDDLVVVLLGDHQPATIVSGGSGGDPATTCRSR